MELSRIRRPISAGTMMALGILAGCGGNVETYQPSSYNGVITGLESPFIRIESCLTLDDCSTYVETVSKDQLYSFQIGDNVVVMNGQVEEAQL